MDPETRSGGLERFDGGQHAAQSLLGELQIMWLACSLSQEPSLRPKKRHSDRVDAALR